MVYLFSIYLAKKQSYMKTLNILFVALTAISLNSCGNSSESQEEKTVYSLNKEKSSLKWKGSTDPSYFHVGSVKITEGTLEMEGEKVVNGTFKIDLNTMVAEDETLPEEKKAKLVTHLKDTSFFFTAEFPMVEVTVNSYENGKLATVISVRGQEITQAIPVKMKKTDKNVTFSGKFDLDVSSLQMEGMQPEEGSDDHVKPIISFEMELVLDKK